MSNTVFRLDSENPDHKEYLGRVDPYTKEPLREGHEIVICGNISCRIAHFLSSWEQVQQCISCKSRKTAARFPSAPPQYEAEIQQKGNTSSRIVLEKKRGHAPLKRKPRRPRRNGPEWVTTPILPEVEKAPQKIHIGDVELDQLIQPKSSISIDKTRVQIPSQPESGKTNTTFFRIEYAFFFLVLLAVFVSWLIMALA